jgi:hypothetical protein
MAEVENIIAAIIVLFVLLVGGLIYLTSFAHDTVMNAGMKESVYRDDAYISDLNSVLKITEPESGRSLGVLLADSVYYRNETLEFNNKTINVTQKTMEILNMSFGTTSYYMVVKPRIIEVSMNFIIDGSDSLDQERQKLADNLKDILTNVERKLNETNAGYGTKLGPMPVVAKIYVLAEKDEECDQFDLHDSRITCEVLDRKKLYLQNMSVNSSSFSLNLTRYDLTAFQTLYNMTSPFTSMSSSLILYTGEYGASDWGYGVAYASNFDEKTTLSRLTLLFPMGDELSTSSIADRCYNTSDLTYWTVCSLCLDQCPVSRSLSSIDKGIRVALDNYHIVNPIFSYSCDYNYSDFYSRKFNQYYNPTVNTSMACNEPQCPGCSVNGSGVCFHPTCRDEILSQMGYMANQTGGSMIDLQDIQMMDINISNTINMNIDQYAIEIGQYLPYQERDVVEVSQPLPNGQLVDVRLWVYKNKKVYI